MSGGAKTVAKAAREPRALTRGFGVSQSCGRYRYWGEKCGRREDLILQTEFDPRGCYVAFLADCLECAARAGAIQVKGDEYWDYDQQVDMEGFTSGQFYSILAKQSRDVTAAISRQKDQVREIRTFQILRGFHLSVKIKCTEEWLHSSLQFLLTPEGLSAEGKAGEREAMSGGDHGKPAIIGGSLSGEAYRVYQGEGGRGAKARNV